MPNSDVIIKNEFLKEISTKSVDSINVSTICNELKIKRQTFYYHYRDIYDLVDSIYTGWTGEILEKDYKGLSYLNILFDFCRDFETIFVNIINGGLGDIVTRFFYNTLTPYVSNLVVDLDEFKNLNNNDVKEIIKYHLDAISIYLVSIFKEIDVNIDHVINKLHIFLDKDNLNNTARLYFERRKEI